MHGDRAVTKGIGSVTDTTGETGGPRDLTFIGPREYAVLFDRDVLIW